MSSSAPRYVHNYAEILNIEFIRKYKFCCIHRHDDINVIPLMFN